LGESTQKENTVNLGATELIIMLQMLIPLALVVWVVRLLNRLTSAVERLAAAAEQHSRETSTGAVPRS
jgi:hypothetical protein